MPAQIEEGGPRDGMIVFRGRLLLVLAGLLSAILLAGLAMRALTEPGDTNSYALLADAFLNGRLHVTDCIDVDCAFYDDKYWVIFPPVPAVVAMPFVALFGTGFSGFIFLATALTALSLVMWWRILQHMLLDRATIAWTVLALAFATPVYYVTIRGDGVWFFAQTVAFLLVTFAVFEVVRGGRLWLAGAAIGLAFLCRQMSLFYLPFLFALALDPDEPLISFRTAHIRRALLLGLPVAAALVVYLVYNEVRFGDPLDTGYNYMISFQGDPDAMITARLQEFGLFSSAYLLFNTLYLFVQGFHVQFGGQTMTGLSGLDPNGTSLLAASPFVLLTFFTPLRRPVVIGLLMIIVMVVPILFYHSNGFSQYNVQRYVLDWLPILIVILGFTLNRAREVMMPGYQVLITYGIGLNVVAMVMLALTV